MNGLMEMSIWKEKPQRRSSVEACFSEDIEELCLSVRSYNSLKRAGCNRICDIIRILDEDENGLKKVRNLGTKSEKEILEKVEMYRQAYEPAAHHNESQPKTRLIIPRKEIWKEPISKFPLSARACESFTRAGIVQVRDLYEKDQYSDPGWFAVRELFAKISSR